MWTWTPWWTTVNIERAWNRGSTNRHNTQVSQQPQPLSVYSHVTFYLSNPLLTHKREEDHSEVAYFMSPLHRLVSTDGISSNFGALGHCLHNFWKISFAPIGWDQLRSCIVWKIFSWELPRSNSIGYTEFVACEWETVRKLNHLKLHTPAHISQVITSSKEKVCGKEPLWT